MVNHKHKHDNDHDNDNGNDKPKEKANIPAPPTGAAGGALTSLAALATALNNVDTTSVAGRSGQPMLLFKREGDGCWMHGQRRTIVEDGSRWAINPLTFRWGFVCFGNNKKLDEHMVSVSQPLPDIAELPDHGFDWQRQLSVSMKCLDGADAGAEVIYKATTDGGLQAVAGLIETVRDRLNGGQHDGKVAPIALLTKDSYQHAQYGRVWTPLIQIVDWMAIDGPPPAAAPKPAPASPAPAEQPRRRRVS